MTAVIKQETQTGTRKAWIDVLRALAMLFVMYGHIIAPDKAYYVFTSPIKIPLFFAISGYVFNDRKGNVGEFLLRLLKTLVIPWLVLNLAQAVLLIPQGMGKIMEYVVEILVGKRCWYLPCCIVAEILFFFGLKFLKKQWKIVVFALAMTLVGLLLPESEIFDLFKFRTALVAQSYLLIGYVFKKNEDFVDRLNNGWIIGGAAAYVLLGVLTLWLYPGQCLDVNTGEYYNYPICAAMIFLGCVLMFALFRKIKRFPKVLELLGRNTLVFYIFHAQVIYAFSLVGVVLPAVLWGKIGKLLLSCAGCAVIAAVLNRILPEIVGKKRVKKQPQKAS